MTIGGKLHFPSIIDKIIGWKVWTRLLCTEYIKPQGYEAQQMEIILVFKEKFSTEEIKIKCLLFCMLSIWRDV